MKKLLFVLFAIIFFSNYNAQEQKRKNFNRNYGEIIEKLDKLIEKRKIDKSYLKIDIADKNFIYIANKDSLVQRNIIRFLPNNRVNVIEIVKNTIDNTYNSKVYEGDFLRNKNFISVRADVLDGKKIALPLTYSFIFQFKENSLVLYNLNNNQKWVQAVDNTPKENLSVSKM